MPYVYIFSQAVKRLMTSDEIFDVLRNAGLQESDIVWVGTRKRLAVNSEVM